MTKQRKKSLGVFILLGASCFIVGIAGCRSYPVQPMPSIRADEAPARTTVAGVPVGAKSYTDSGEIKAIFNYDLMGKGVLPVFLVVDNRSDREIELLRARFEFETPSGSQLVPISPAAASTGHGRNAMAEAFWIGGIFSYDNANKFNEDMERDWINKAWPEVALLRPGRTKSGFLYFKVGEDFSASGSRLRIPFEIDQELDRENAILTFE